MSYFQSLSLTNFRNYASVKMEGLEKGLVILYGANGAGKTNILESISLLSPGRGIRKAKVQEIQKKESESPWAASGIIDNTGAQSRIGTGRDPKSNKRIIRINGENAKSQSALSDYVACLWLTPQMDGLFLGGAGERRRFLDRMIYAFDPAHAGRVTRYDNIMRQRSRILTEEQYDPTWLDGLEAQMAETGVAIAASRLEFANALQAACTTFKTPHFPHADIAVTGMLENQIPNVPALKIEDMFKESLKNARPKDQITGGADVGPHKSDLCVHYTSKFMPADQCSTGEQKSLLIGIILAHAMMIKQRRGVPPILLLDEVAAHLDGNRRAALYELLTNLNGQIWLTGTDKSLFEKAQSENLFCVEDGTTKKINRV